MFPTIPPLLALMLLAFTTRRMVISAHLALSSLHFTAQFDFAVTDRYSYEKMHTALLGTARWADLWALVTKSNPRLNSSGLMWWLVVRWAYLALPTMPHAYILNKARFPSLEVGTQMNIAIQTFKILNDLPPTYLLELIEKRCRTRNWNWNWNLVPWKCDRPIV